MITKTIILKEKYCRQEEGISNKINYLEITWAVFGFPLYIKEEYIG